MRENNADKRFYVGVLSAFIFTMLLGCSPKNSPTGLSDTTLKIKARLKEQVLLPSKNVPFMVGDSSLPTPTREYLVVLSHNFWIDTTEVTHLSYTTLTGRESYARWPLVQNNDNKPVDGVTWYDALLYCNARSKRDAFDTCYFYTGITWQQAFPLTTGAENERCIAALQNLRYDSTSNGYRLPTVEEWEFACRAGTTTRFYWGNVLDSSHSWNRANHEWLSVADVALKLPNAFLLYDMIGNAEEWCFDTLPYVPGGPTGMRLTMGGGTSQVADYLGSGARSHAYPWSKGAALGFRCVRNE